MPRQTDGLPPPFARFSGTRRNVISWLSQRFSSPTQPVSMAHTRRNTCGFVETCQCFFNFRGDFSAVDARRPPTSSAAAVDFAAELYLVEDRGDFAVNLLE